MIVSPGTFDYWIANRITFPTVIGSVDVGTFDYWIADTKFFHDCTAPMGFPVIWYHYAMLRIN